MRSPKASTVMLALLAVFVFLAKIVLNGLGGAGLKPFPNSIANISATFPLDITPAGWAFSIWSLIYLWNAAYIIYALTTAFRDVPPVLNELFFLLYILCDLANITWLYTFTSGSVGSSSVVLVINQLLLYMVLFVAYSNYMTYKKDLENNYTADSYCIRILVHNGIMLNTAWVTIASLLGIAMDFVYKLKWPMPLSCCVALSLLLIIAIAWFALENFTFQTALNYTYADWPVVLWALSASIAKNWDPDSISAKYTVALLVITSLLFIARIALQVVHNKNTFSVWHYRRPAINVQLIQPAINE